MPSPASASPPAPTSRCSPTQPARVLRPAILWNDQRSAAQAEALHARAGDIIIHRSLNRVNPTWTLAMLAWLQEHEPEVTTRATRLYPRQGLPPPLAHQHLGDRLLGRHRRAHGRQRQPLLVARTLRADRLEPRDPAADRRPPPPSSAGVTAAAAAATGLSPGTPVVCAAPTTPPPSSSASARSGPAWRRSSSPPPRCSRWRPTAPAYTRRSPATPHIVPGLYYTATGNNSCASAHRWLRDLMFPGGLRGDGRAGRHPWRRAPTGCCSTPICKASGRHTGTRCCAATSSA